MWSASVHNLVWVVRPLPFSEVLLTPLREAYKPLEVLSPKIPDEQFQMPHEGFSKNLSSPIKEKITLPKEGKGGEAEEREHISNIR